jgi:signal transduction histidine kinase
MMAELEWALMRERSSEDYLEALETCRRAGTRMQALVEGLLTLARAESGELPLQQVETRVDGIVDDTIEMLRPYAEQRRVRLHASLSPEAVVGDADRLHDLASNLIFNAIAYNRPGGTVTVEVTRDRHMVVFRVRDTGIGIAASDMPKIFDRFYRGDMARTREPAGAGLGLALAKWIVRAHHGSIECSSEPGRHTEVVVLLPSADHAAAAAGNGRRSARFVTPPIAPTASAASVRPSVQVDVSPSTASSE